MKVPPLTRDPYPFPCFPAAFRLQVAMTMFRLSGGAVRHWETKQDRSASGVSIAIHHTNKTSLLKYCYFFSLQLVFTACRMVTSIEFPSHTTCYFLPSNMCRFRGGMLHTVTTDSYTQSLFTCFRSESGLERVEYGGSDGTCDASSRHSPRTPLAQSHSRFETSK